jgi:acyl carrier protein
MSQTEAEVRRILQDHGQLPVSMTAVPDDADLFDLGMTSHASVNVMLALEDAFDVEFPDAMLRRSTFETIAAISTALEGLGAQAPTA